jgi:mRNA interferase MazF
MSFSRGDIVLVDYPFSDRTGSKVRPALVVQNDTLNSRITDTILVSISRSTHRASATQLFIDLGTPDGAKTGLRQNSMVQCENLLTHVQRLILVKSAPCPRYYCSE